MRHFLLSPQVFQHHGKPESNVQGHTNSVAPSKEVCWITKTFCCFSAIFQRWLFVEVFQVALPVQDLLFLRKTGYRLPELPDCRYHVRIETKGRLPHKPELPTRLHK